MFVHRTNRIIRSSLNKISIREPAEANKGCLFVVASRGMSASEIGSGAGKGGGSGGSVREAGGALGKKGAAQEEMYFSKQNKEMKDKLKEHLKSEIKKHEDAIKANKQIMNEIDK